MDWTSSDILKILDNCCDHFTFPMLDNGYFYLAATRLSLYRSSADWALVIEVFGYSPRSGIPDIYIYTFGSSLVRHSQENQYASPEAYERYLLANPNNDFAYINPIGPSFYDLAHDVYFYEEVSGDITLRGRIVDVPAIDDYAANGIDLKNPPSVLVFEFCRLLAALERNEVLSTPEERRICVPLDLQQILQLEEWHHPDVVTDDRPSGNITFRQLAEVLVTGDISIYTPIDPSNTHWSNWPDGGAL